MNCLPLQYSPINKCFKGLLCLRSHGTPYILWRRQKYYYDLNKFLSVILPTQSSINDAFITEKKRFFNIGIMIFLTLQIIASPHRYPGIRTYFQTYPENHVDKNNFIIIPLFNFARNLT